MSQTYNKKKGLKNGILGPYSGKIEGIVIQKNGRIRINQKSLIKRSRKND